MIFRGYTPQTLPRHGSLVQYDDEQVLPLGVASSVRNCQYRAETIGPAYPPVNLQKLAVAGLGVLRFLAGDGSQHEDLQLVAAGVDGNIYNAITGASYALPEGLAPAPNLYPQMSQAYNRILLARGDLIAGQQLPLTIGQPVLSSELATGIHADSSTYLLDQASDLPVGSVLEAGHYYRPGQIVSPTLNSSELMQCTGGGVYGSAPSGSYPQAQFAAITISAIAGLAAPPAPTLGSLTDGNALPAGATLFLVATLVNAFGESTANVVNPDGTLGDVLQVENTGGDPQGVQVTLPNPSYPVPAGYAPTGVNLYGFLSLGTPDPNLYLDPTAYAQIASGLPLGGSYTVTAAPTGALLPDGNNAYTTPEGHVSSGVRYMIVLFVMRSEYITGVRNAVAVRCDVSVDGRQIFVPNLPLGPANTIARICAFTVAGQGSAGPYFYINNDDFVDPGQGEAKIKQTATLIPDNTTTMAYFDFLDTYLEGASEVTNYFDRIEIPPASDAHFLRSINRVAYAGCAGYDFLVSDLEDAEAVRVPGSNIAVSPADGDRAVCWRELGDVQIALKENSGHVVTPSAADPTDWDVRELWRGQGPAGPRAVDVADTDGERMMVFAHRSGGYMYTGQGAPTLITRELIGTPETPGLWERINWKYGHLIKVLIDPQARIIRFFVPLDGSTTHNKVIACSYYWGVDDPVIFAQRTGRLVPNTNGRKWSLDDIAAGDAVFLPNYAKGVE